MCGPSFGRFPFGLTIPRVAQIFSEGSTISYNRRVVRQADPPRAMCSRGPKPAVYESAPEGFQADIPCLRALFFRTQNSVSLGPRYAEVRGKPPRLAMLDV